MKKIAICMLIFLAVINVLYGGAGIIQEIFSNTLFPNSKGVYIVTDLLGSFAYIASFILPVFFFYLISKKDDAEPMDLSMRLPEKRTVFKMLSVVFIGISVILTLAQINSMVVPSSGIMEDFYDDSFTKPYKLVLMFFSTAVVPAFVEEFMFRGMIYTNLRPYGRGPAIFISALLFGLMHQNAEQLLYATAAGIVLALVFELTGSFWCCVLLHFFNNFFSIIENAWWQNYSEVVASRLCVLAEVGVFFLGLVFGAIWVILEKKDKNRVAPAERSFFGVSEDHFSETVPVRAGVCARGFFNPIMIVFLVLSALQMISIYVLYGM